MTAHELLLLRHSKSDWPAGVSDFDRPLKKRGKRASDRIGQWLVANDLVPDTVIASPANRAISTAKRVCAAMSLDADLRARGADAAGSLVADNAAIRCVEAPNPASGPAARRLIRQPWEHAMSDIEYYYSAHSAFAYLGSARFMGIASASGHRIVHKPIELGPVIEAGGAGSTRTRSKAHRAYYFGREIQRWAEERNAPVVNGIPTHHYNGMTLPNGMLIACAEQGGDTDRLAHCLLEAHWKDDADLAERETLAWLAQTVDIDPGPLLDAALSDEIQAIYKANTQEAVDRLVFGSPAYFVAGDMFYGKDRLEMVERALTKTYAGSWPPA